MVPSSSASFCAHQMWSGVSQEACCTKKQTKTYVHTAPCEDKMFLERLLISQAKDLQDTRTSWLHCSSAARLLLLLLLGVPGQHGLVRLLVHNLGPQTAWPHSERWAHAGMDCQHPRP